MATALKYLGDYIDLDSRKPDTVRFSRQAEYTSFSTPIRSIFNSYADKWKKEHALSSFCEDRNSSSTYRAIVAIGPEVVPFILERMQKEPEQWFEALTEITGEDPVKEDHYGYIEMMATDWLLWGKNKGII